MLMMKRMKLAAVKRTKENSLKRFVHLIFVCHWTEVYSPVLQTGLEFGKESIFPSLPLCIKNLPFQLRIEHLSI